MIVRDQQRHMIDLFEESSELLGDKLCDQAQILYGF